VACPCQTTPPSGGPLAPLREAAGLPLRVSGRIATFTSIAALALLNRSKQEARRGVSRLPSAASLSLGGETPRLRGPVRIRAVRASRSFWTR